jgi:hypothetical protein
VCRIELHEAIHFIAEQIGPGLRHRIDDGPPVLRRWKGAGGVVREVHHHQPCVGPQERPEAVDVKMDRLPIRQVRLPKVHLAAQRPRCLQSALRQRMCLRGAICRSIVSVLGTEAGPCTETKLCPDFTS